MNIFIQATNFRRRCAHCAPPARRRQHQRTQGLTMIELLITMAILAILGALASPSFQNAFERYRVSQAVEAMRSSVFLARSEAMRRGGNVVLRQSGTGWEQGWVVFTDLNGNNEQDLPAEPSLQNVASLSNTNIANTDAFIRFDRFGRASLNGTAFTVYPSAKLTTDPSAKTLSLSAGGRLSVR